MTVQASCAMTLQKLPDYCLKNHDKLAKSKTKWIFLKKYLEIATSYRNSLKLMLRLCTQNTHYILPPIPIILLLLLLRSDQKTKKRHFIQQNIKAGDHDPPSLVLSFLNYDRFYQPLCIVYYMMSKNK